MLMHAARWPAVEASYNYGGRIVGALWMSGGQSIGTPYMHGRANARLTRIGAVLFLDFGRRQTCIIKRINEIRS